MTDQPKPTLALTMGDPAGVGAEVIVKALSDHSTRSVAHFLVVGALSTLRATADRLGSPVEFLEVAAVPHRWDPTGPVPVLQPEGLDPAGYRLGEVQAACGEASIAFLTVAGELAMRHGVDGIVSGPINKAAVKLAGYRFIDQAAFFAELTGVDEGKTTTLLHAAHMNAVMVTKHIPLREVAAAITQERVAWVIDTAADIMGRLQQRPARIAVSALNPHAGEEGLLGDEEIRVLRPAVVAAQGAGIDALGPIPGKNAFDMMHRRQIDVVVAMYHDQTAPVSLLGGPSATVTLGIPILRTSLGHGTAFDIAGHGVADPTSCIAAIRLTSQLVASPSTTPKGT